MLRLSTFIFCLLLMPLTSTQAYNNYGKYICKQAGYHCVKVKRGDTWSRLFPNATQREIVRKVNRMNTRLRSGMLIAVPNQRNASLLSLAPFPHKISPSSGGVVRIDLRKLAWGAYDTSGRLVRWGPASGGKNYCADVKRACRTVAGTYTVYRRQGAGCKSSVYPRPRGGAPMPYCMHFYRGYAMHGSNTVPGYNASHGCVRMFTSDARWLNKNFVKVGITRVRISR